MVYGTARDASGAAMADTWIRLQQGSNTAVTKTDEAGFYLLFDGQACGSEEIHSCGGSWASKAVNFGNGSTSTTLTFLGQGGSGPGATPAFPAGWTKAEVWTVTKISSLATITEPSYTLSVKKGDAYDRNFRFHN
jgi:hypothetical protein